MRKYQFNYYWIKKQLLMQNRRLWKQIGHQSAHKNYFFEEEVQPSQKVEGDQKEQENQDDFLQKLQELGLETIVEVQQVTQTTNEDHTHQLNLQYRRQNRVNQKIKIIRESLQGQKKSVKELRQTVQLFRNQVKGLLKVNKKQINTLKTQASEQMAKIIRLLQKKLTQQFEQEKKKYIADVQSSRKRKNAENEKYQQEISQLKKKVKSLQNNIKQSEDSLKIYSIKVINLQKQKAKYIQKQIEIEVKNQKLEGEIQEEIQIKNERQKLLLEIQEERNNFCEQNRALKRKIIELDEEVEKRLDQEIQKVRRESQTIQNQFYLKEMENLDDQMSLIRQKYHDKNEELDKRQQIIILKEQEIEKAQILLEEEKDYLQNFEKKLLVWDNELKEKNEELKKQKQFLNHSTLYSPKNTRFVDKKIPNYDGYASRVYQKSYLKPERDEDNFYNKSRQSFVNPPTPSSYRSKNRRMTDSIYQKDRFDDSEKGMFKSIKQRKLDYEINTLDSRLRNIQRQMKRQIEQLKNKM